MSYDVVVVGASFAGLTLARRLRGRVLLIDRQPVGAGQTSACGTPVAVLEALGAADTAYQTHDALVVHFPTRTVSYRLPYPFCTFDYPELCRRLFAETKADLLQTLVTGFENGAVVTDAGRIRAPIIVDASGWRAVVAKSIVPGYVDRSTLSFGMETVVPYREEGLHFWLDPAVLPGGIGWIFPGGQHSHIGLGSYIGKTDLKRYLLPFLARFGLGFGERMQGGYLPWGLRDPIAGDVFVVGDAAGQCLGFSGEGIRPAMYFADACARAIQDVVDGRKTLHDGLDTYRGLVNRHAWMFRMMANAQRSALRVPPWLLGPAGLLAAPSFMFPTFMKPYRSWAAPEVLAFHA